MQTRTFIEPTANVVRVTNLKAGDVYKRLPGDNEPYGIAKDQLLFGIVTDVLHNGSEVALVALEFQVAYNGAEAKPKTFRGSNDIALFPATPEEVAAHLDELVQTQERAVEQARRDLTSKLNLLDRITVLFASTDELTAPAIEVEAIEAGS